MYQKSQEDNSWFSYGKILNLSLTVSPLTWGCRVPLRCLWGGPSWVCWHADTLTNCGERSNCLSHGQNHHNLVLGIYKTETLSFQVHFHTNLMTIYKQWSPWRAVTKGAPEEGLPVGPPRRRSHFITQFNGEGIKGNDIKFVSDIWTLLALD